MNTMNQQDVIKFYNEESSYYALKRYDSPMVDFTQFYFRKRLAIALEYIKIAAVDKKNLNLLEVGCADGVVMRKINDKFPGMFGHMVGVDISPKMIDEAKKRNINVNSTFFARGSEDQGVHYDFILELGFLIEPILETEFEFVAQKLNYGGYFICSLSLKNSFRMLFKSKDNSYRINHLTLKQYEVLLGKHFKIIRKDVYGFFIPYLWRMPKIARIIQPFLEKMLDSFFPNFFHEAIYLVQKK